MVPAATVTTDAKPNGQQQLARDLEVERAVMGQRCRPQSFGEVQRCNPLCFLLTAAQCCCCSWASLTDQLVRKFKDSWGINTTMKKFFIFVPVQTKKKMWANDSTGYTLVEPRHIRVPFVYRDYTHAADWPAPHFTLICRGSTKVYPFESFAQKVITEPVPF